MSERIEVLGYIFCTQMPDEVNGVMILQTLRTCHLTVCSLPKNDTEHNFLEEEKALRSCDSV